MIRTSVFFVALALFGCGGRPSPVILQGEPASIRSLAGEWAGEYWSAASERRGVINFSLAAGSDSAYGDVLMFAPLGQPIHAADRAEEHLVHARQAQSLRIDFVNVSFGGVRGVLEPYIAPDCQCAVTTHFTGAIVGDTIRGTFITRGDVIGIRDGVWFMVRRNGQPTP
jgi:hypothetical protein